MTDYEIYSFEAFRKHLHDDERPVERASKGLLDEQKISDYIRRQSIDHPGYVRLFDSEAQI